MRFSGRILMLVYKRSYLLVIVFIPFLLFGCTNYVKSDWSRENVTKSGTKHLYEVQIAAKTYASPGLPDVLMIGMCHVGYPEFYDRVGKKLKEADIIIAEGAEMVYNPTSNAAEKKIEFTFELQDLAHHLATYFTEIQLPGKITTLSDIVNQKQFQLSYIDTTHHGIGPFGLKQIFKDPWGHDVMYFPSTNDDGLHTRDSLHKKVTPAAMFVSYGLNGVYDGEDPNSDDITIPIAGDPWWVEVDKKLEGMVVKKYLEVKNLRDGAVAQGSYLQREENWIPGDWMFSNFKEHWKTPDQYINAEGYYYANEDEFIVWWLNPYHYWVRKSYLWGRHPEHPSANARNDRVWDLIHFHITKNPKNAKVIGIPWGFSHMPDFEERLLKEFGYKMVEEEWITIWSDSRSSGFINTLTREVLRHRTAQDMSESQIKEIEKLLDY